MHGVIGDVIYIDGGRVLVARTCLNCYQLIGM